MVSTGTINYHFVETREEAGDGPHCKASLPDGRFPNDHTEIDHSPLARLIRPLAFRYILHEARTIDFWRFWMN